MKGYNPMFRSLFTNFTYAGSGCPGRAARRFVTQAASLAAITVLMLGTLSGPAVAQATNTPLRVYFTSLYCMSQSNDNTWPNPDHDEPYVLILVADLRGSNAYAHVFASQTFSDVDKNDTRSDMLQIWALDGNGSPIDSNDDYVMLAAVLESDNSRNKDAIVARMTVTYLPKLVTYKAYGMSRSEIAGHLRADMQEAIDISRNFSGDADDQVGPIVELLWDANGLSAARRGYAVELHPGFYGNDMWYLLTFRLE
jgi:hypothetical protein